jgi:hypothetical protein
MLAVRASHIHWETSFDNEPYMLAWDYRYDMRITLKSQGVLPSASHSLSDDISFQMIDLYSDRLEVHFLHAAQDMRPDFPKVLIGHVYLDLTEQAQWQARRESGACEGILHLYAERFKLTFQSYVNAGESIVSATMLICNSPLPDRRTHLTRCFLTGRS